MTPKTTIAWAAGFFEGDGSVNWSGSLLRLNATQTDLEPLRRLQDLFGGFIHEKKCYSNLSRKPQWLWQIQGKPAQQAFKRMRPYLGTPVRERYDSLGVKNGKVARAT
jgi:hypothetical protein